MNQLRTVIRQHKHVVVLALVGMALVLEVATFAPMMHKASKAKEATARMQKQIQDIRNEAAQMEAMISSGIEPGLLMQEVEVSELIPALLEEIALFGKKYGVEIYNLVPEGTTESLRVRGTSGGEATYTRQTLMIRATSTYMALGMFLKDLEEGPLTVVVEGMDIRKTSERGRRLDVALVVSAFVKG